MLKSNIIYTIIGIFVLLFSCKREVPQLNKNKKVEFPSRTLINANIISKDSGKISMNIRSPLIEEYTLVDSPYTIFRKGISGKVNFFRKKRENVHTG